MRASRFLIATFVLGVLLVPAPRAAGQAYCALRDPVNQIYELFPEATGYRSIVSTVDDAARRAVQQRSAFDLHFNELGRHTLYVAVNGRQPIGLVHVRSERGERGMTEVAWALDLDLRVRDFRLQRSRSRFKADIAADAFRRQFAGRGLDWLQGQLDARGELRPGAELTSPVTAAPLASSVARSAVKTILVTESVWERELESLRVLGRALAAFPAGVSVESVVAVYDADLVAALTTAGAEPTAIDRGRTFVGRVLDETGAVVGTIVRARVTAMTPAGELWWAVDPADRVTSVTTTGSWPDAATRAAFEHLVGATLADAADCATAAEMVTVEALVLAEAHAAGR